MKDLVYPAVLYRDEEGAGYTIKIPDLGIVTDGDNVVDAYIRAKEFLCATIDCAIKFDCDIEAPTDFEKVYKENKNYIVLLIDALA